MHRFISFIGLLSLTAGFLSAKDLPRSPASDAPSPGVIRAQLLASEVTGLPLATVFYDLQGAASITGGDKRARLEIEKAFSISEGSLFDPNLASAALMKVRNLTFVQQADFAIYESSRPGQLVLVLTVTLGTREDGIGPHGILIRGPRDYPTLYQTEHAMLRVLLNGGFGFFSDGNPWFGNAGAFTASSPIALDPADGESATWFEASVEYGIGGVMQLGSNDLWAFGAATYLSSFSTGQDLFRSDTRDYTAIEDAYLGFVFHPDNSPWVFNVSAGRQNWQLNDGFLISQFAGAANAGPYPGLYLNPRTAFEMTGVIKIHRNNFGLEAFYLDPSEIGFLESDTSFAGIHATYNALEGWEGSFVYYEVLESKTVFNADLSGPVPREDQQTSNLRFATTRLFGVDGLELGGEVAYQTHHTVDWDAWAYYARIGYSFRNLPWSPNLRYRYASFSGDDPSTATYERFDAPLSSGLDTWVQGVNVRKVASNSNLDTHRIRLNLSPSTKLSLTLDYFWLMANESAGGPREIAQEVDLAIRWSINSNLFFLGVAGVAFPGDRLRDQAGTDLDSWTTLQASLFWSY